MLLSGPEGDEVVKLPTYAEKQYTKKMSYKVLKGGPTGDWKKIYGPSSSFSTPERTQADKLTIEILCMLTVFLLRKLGTSSTENTKWTAGLIARVGVFTLNAS